MARPIDGELGLVGAGVRFLRAASIGGTTGTRPAGQVLRPSGPAATTRTAESRRVSANGAPASGTGAPASGTGAPASGASAPADHASAPANDARRPGTPSMDPESIRDLVAVARQSRIECQIAYGTGRQRHAKVLDR